MSSGVTYFEAMIEKYLLNIHTGYLGKVLSVEGKTARIQPLTLYKAVGGNAKEAKPTSAYVPLNIKYKPEKITYMKTATTSETKTVLVPDELKNGDIVFVGICERDISNAINGIISEETNRHHDINDGVILKVVG